jgi:hypothetical protein
VAVREVKRLAFYSFKADMAGMSSSHHSALKRSETWLRKAELPE